jgi:alpha-1,2-mannosyltransferase
VEVEPINMSIKRANVLHIDLNARGGAERVAIATITALIELGIDVDLTSCAKPDFQSLAYSFGNDFICSLRKIKNFNIISASAELSSKERICNQTATTNLAEKSDQKNSTYYDITINTHGDVLPFYHDGLDKENAITYCHYPLGKYCAHFKDNKQYFDMIAPFSDLSKRIMEKRIGGNSSITDDDMANFAEQSYDLMIRHTRVLTNSDFSRHAIGKAVGVNDCQVIYPPIDIDLFSLRNKEPGFTTAIRNEDNVLVVSRFNPTKRIENAIMLAKLLRAKKIARKVVIAGNLVPGCEGYYNYLMAMIARYSLNDFVKLEANVSLDRLITLMKEAKAYFHCLIGEPFGMSAAEAMSTGAVAVVPSLGGFTEFVKNEYQFDTFGGAAERIDSALNASDLERKEASDMIKKFSTENFIRSLQDIVVRL